MTGGEESDAAWPTPVAYSYNKLEFNEAENHITRHDFNEDETSTEQIEGQHEHYLIAENMPYMVHLPLNPNCTASRSLGCDVTSTSGEGSRLARLAASAATLNLFQGSSRVLLAFHLY